MSTTEGTAPESAPNQGGNETGEQTPDAGGEFKAITSQEDLNRVIAERLRRDRSKFADYEDLKAKAARLDEIEQANKSEAERLAEEAATARTEADKARIEVLRFRIAAKHGISDENAELFLTGSDEDSLTRQAERLAAMAQDAGKPRSPRPDPSQGRSTSGTASTAQQFEAALSGLL